MMIKLGIEFLRRDAALGERPVGFHFGASELLARFINTPLLLFVRGYTRSSLGVRIVSPALLTAPTTKRVACITEGYGTRRSGLSSPGGGSSRAIVPISVPLLFSGLSSPGGGSSRPVVAAALPILAAK